MALRIYRCDGCGMENRAINDLTGMRHVHGPAAVQVLWPLVAVLTCAGGAGRGNAYRVTDGGEPAGPRVPSLGRGRPPANGF